MYYTEHPRDKDGIGWVVDILDKYSRTARSAFHVDGLSIFHGRPTNSTSRKNADSDIMICAECNSCWEYGTTPGERDYYVYDNFPKLGKEKKVICPPCAKSRL